MPLFNGSTALSALACHESPCFILFAENAGKLLRDCEDYSMICSILFQQAFCLCDFLKDMFEDYFYFEKVYDETKLLINYSDYEKDASLKGEFIRMVLGSDMDEEKKSEVIKAGIMALSGEEI